MIPTVITPAVYARLAAPQGVRMDLGLAADSPSDQNLLRAIDQASSRVRTYCNRAFGRQIYRERILKMPADGFLLSAGPVNRIISVGIQGGAVYEADDYLLDGGKLRLTYGSSSGAGDRSDYNLWCALRPALVVDYEAGWLLPGEEIGDDFTGETPLPADIEKAVTQLIAVSMSEAGRDLTVKQDTVEGIGSTSYYVQGAGSALPHPGAEAALAPYRVLALV